MWKYTDLERRYRIKKKGLTTVIEELKQSLKAKTERLKDISNGYTDTDKTVRLGQTRKEFTRS